MCSRITLGKVLLNGINGFEINENILEMSNTAKITIPRQIRSLQNKPILEFFGVGDKVKIESGYYADNSSNLSYAIEFTGYIREIESDFPLIIHCEDESYVLRQKTYIESYRAATLKQILTDIIPKDITFDCPDVNIGKYHIDKVSTFTVLNELVHNYGLYSRLNNGHLKVGLAYDFAEKSTIHKYDVKYDVKKNELKYKRKEDNKMRFKAVATNPNGKKTTVTIGSNETNASERTLNFAGPMTEAELKKAANGIMAKIIYDGYSGSITGFGTPYTHAGDALKIIDQLEPERAGTYLIERVDITYNDSTGYSRQNTLSYKLDTKKE
ncbi:MAG: hypothetical protein WCJ61_16185 [Paludibacter sp.]